MLTLTFGNELLAATEQRMRESLQELKFILAATAGTGKTTQITMWLLSLEAIQGRIIVIEPSRPLAQRAARLVRLHLGEEHAHLVGSVVRFENDVPEGARLVFMTPGIFFEFWGGDPSLEEVGTVVFDEAHDRSTQSLVLEGMVRGLCKTQRPDLICGAMSATLDTELYAKRWGIAPITYEGRRFPLGVHYRPWTPVEDVVAEIMKTREPGLILVFQPGKAEIAACEEALRKRFPKLEIRYLHAELESEALEAAFAKTQGWVVTLATNAVEPGVTFPHERCYVIDTGLERYNIYDPVLDVDFLPLVRISDQSATQRAERAPRNGPGDVYRQWDAALELPERRVSEIKRVRLSGVLLRLLSLGIALDETLADLLETPPAENVEAGLRELERLGAIDSVITRVVTTIGRQMNALPLEPRTARAVIDAACQGCLPVFLTLAALQSVKMPLLLCPKDKEERLAARLAHAAFRRDEDASDLYALLRVYEALEKEEEEQRDAAAFAGEHYLSYRAYREARQVREQLVKKMRRLGYRWRDEHRVPRTSQLVRSLWRGCLQHLVYYDPQVKCWKLVGRGDVEHRILIGHESFAPWNPGGHTLGLASGLRRIVSRDEGVLLLASEVTLLSADLMREMFPDQITTATSYRYDPMRRAVVRVEGCYWSGAGDTPLCLGERVTSLEGGDLVDPVPTEATRALAEAIASGVARPFSFGYRTTQRRRTAIHRLRAMGGVEVPLVDNELLTELLMQQLGAATTLRAVDSGDHLKVSWGAFEKALKVTGLRRQVELQGAFAQA